MSIKSNATAVGDSVVFNGKLSDSVFKLKNINITSFEDGIIELKVIIKDSLGNEMMPVKSNIYKDTKDPTITFKKTSITDLSAIYTIESNEYLSNALIKDSLKINIGKIDSIAKVGNKLYNIFITRVCNDTLLLTLKPNSLSDTVGNKNITTSLNTIEKLIPIAPIVKDTNYCNNANADTLKVTSSAGATLLWYGTNAIGGTGSNTAIKPSTTTIGSVNYYLSQIITTTGCEGPRSKIAVTINPIPSAPSLSRDTANFLLSGATGTTWYKDGFAITDTVQKYKPITAGSYTAKTTTNGCTSVISSAYYYLVTDIINLSKDEFIKLAPNPFMNQLNFDFIVKGYQKLNIEVYDIATGTKVASLQNITAGTQLQLSQLARGTYIIRITSNDIKIMQQFKVVKL
jgi:hypothetical protein